jgi:hypothetical protein
LTYHWAIGSVAGTSIADIILAVLTIGRDCDSLAVEIELEKTIAPGS